MADYGAPRRVKHLDILQPDPPVVASSAASNAGKTLSAYAAGSGGKARMKKLDAAGRRALAQKAAKARWDKVKKLREAETVKTPDGNEGN